MQLFRGNGYMADFKCEQLCRDAKVLQTMGRTRFKSPDCALSALMCAHIWAIGIGSASRRAARAMRPVFRPTRARRGSRRGCEPPRDADADASPVNGFGAGCCTGSGRRTVLSECPTFAAPVERDASRLRLDEISGLAVSRTIRVCSGWHNDSGDSARIFAVRI